jgi:hypothetical protein
MYTISHKRKGGQIARLISYFFPYSFTYYVKLRLALVTAILLR